MCSEQTTPGGQVENMKMITNSINFTKFRDFFLVF